MPVPSAPRPRPRLDWRRADHWIAFGLGAGLVPRAPGTAGAAVGTLLYWLFLTDLAAPLYALLVVLAFALGVVVCHRVSKELGVADHGAIVWDEVVGVWLTLGPAGDDWPWIVAGFLLFRVLDIAKPWPVGWVDSHVKGGLGVMLDDAVAGAVALLLLAGARSVTGL